MIIDKTNYTTVIDDFWRKCVALYSGWAELHGLSYYEFLILYMLNRHGRITQKEIVTMSGIPKQSVSNAAQKLCEKSYIEYIISKEDRREKDMILTRLGAEFVKKSIVPLVRIEEEVFDRIGAEQITKMLETSMLFYDLIGKGIKGAV